MTDLEAELKTKKICRFCLCQDEKLLSNLYSRENRLKNSAPLPLQVMACVSIEVFTNDGMPSTVCDNCRMLMEHCYRFKQMCKKADTALRQFPLTRKWPSQLDHPKIPQQLLNTQNLKILNTNAPKTEITTYQPNLSPKSTPEKQKPQIKKKSPNTHNLKLLNKNPIKILNKDALLAKEPFLKQPIIKQSKDGTIELVTEIIDTESYKEIDPVKSAEPIETNVFPCPHCERSFPLCQLLDIHMVNHNRERNYQCEHCDKKFFTKYDLGKHALIHSNDKPFKCLVCEKSFTRSTLLQRHEKIHTDIPKFLCLHCEKPFISKEELAKHTERHNKKRPFSCKICDKSFAFKQGLERHEAVHAKDQPFPCQYCNLSFSTPTKLSRHLTAHAGARPYPCKLCKKSYVLSHHLSRHLRSHKEGLGIFKCYDCLQTFASRDSLIYHSAVHATQTLICPICKEQFDEIDSVTEHIKMHALGEQYACEFCDLIFMTQDKLDNHCAQDHAEDMAVYKYNEHNFKYENESQEVYTGPEILQEFIIEEYHDENIQQFNDHTHIKEEIIFERNYTDNEYTSNPKTKKRKRKISVEELQTTLEDTDDQNYDSNLVFTDDESALFEEIIQEPAKKSKQINGKKLKESPTKNSNSQMKHNIPTTVLNSQKEDTITKKDNISDIHVIEDNVIKESKTTVGNKIMNTSASVKTKTNANLNKLNEGNPPKDITPEKSKTIKIGDKKIKVKKITITKAQAAIMAKQGRIDFSKEGAMILKQDPNKKKKQKKIIN